MSDDYLTQLIRQAEATAATVRRVSEAAHRIQESLKWLPEAVGPTRDDLNAAGAALAAELDALRRDLFGDPRVSLPYPSPLARLRAAIGELTERLATERERTAKLRLRVLSRVEAIMNSVCEEKPAGEWPPQPADEAAARGAPA